MFTTITFLDLPGDRVPPLLEPAERSPAERPPHRCGLRLLRLVGLALPAACSSSRAWSDFWAGHALERTDDERRAATHPDGWQLSTNLGILGFFKYFNFFVDSFAAARWRRSAGTSTRSRSASCCRSASPSTRSRSMSYTIDVYRGELAPTQRPDRLLRVRRRSSRSSSRARSCAPRDLLPQSRAPARFDYEQARPTAAACIALGLLQEDASSPTTSRRVVDAVFARPARIGGARRWPSPVCSSPSRSTATSPATPTSPSGSAQLLGFELMRELRPPYFARASRSSGGAGTSRCRPGCATTSTSRSAATARAPGATYRNLMTHDAARRPLARRRVDLRRLGRRCTARRSCRRAWPRRG